MKTNFLLNANIFASITMEDANEDSSFTRFNYKLVSTGLATNSIILIDVRDLAKRLREGRIPGSLHVPCTLVV